MDEQLQITVLFGYDHVSTLKLMGCLIEEWEKDINTIIHFFISGKIIEQLTIESRMGHSRVPMSPQQPRINWKVHWDLVLRITPIKIQPRQLRSLHSNEMERYVDCSDGFVHQGILASLIWSRWAVPYSLRWHHNGRDGVSNHQPDIIYLTVYSSADQRKSQSFASLAFVRGIHRWPVNSPHKWPGTRKMFSFDDVIMSPPSLFGVIHIYC